MIPGWSQVQMGIVAALALALLVACGVASCQSRRADTEAEKRQAVESQLSTAIDANTSAIDTVNALRGALKEWRDLSVTPEEAAIAAASMGEIRALANQLRAEIEKAKGRDRAKPECGALLGANLERMCPGIAVGLRRAQDRDQDDLGGNSGSGREAAPARAHDGLRTALPLPGH